MTEKSKTLDLSSKVDIGQHCVGKKCNFLLIRARTLVKFLKRLSGH